MQIKFVLFFIFLGLTRLMFGGGLKNIIVEKYYTATAKDEMESGVTNKLKAGSITYRIYVELLPDYTFQAAYGTKEHTLKINTTTTFFNHIKGSTFANGIPDVNLKDPYVAYDSWLSVGAASAGNFGILTTEDKAHKDGLLPGNPAQVTSFGLDEIASVFKSTNSVTGPCSFTTNNGSWACLGGTKGPTASNRILIAQVTTDGVLSFDLNIQLGKSNGSSEKYVAHNAKEGEIESILLTYPQK